MTNLKRQQSMIVVGLIHMRSERRRRLKERAGLEKNIKSGFTFENATVVKFIEQGVMKHNDGLSN